MSKVSIEGNALGSGTFTIAAPNSNTSYTLTLPESTGTMVVTGGAQTIEFAAGTVSAPSITTTGDTNTGIFFPAADTIAFAEGGAERMRIDSSGNVGIGTTSPSTYGKFAVSGLAFGSSYYVTSSSGGAAGGARFGAYFGSVNVGYVDHAVTDGTGSAEKADIRFGTINSGTLAERMRITFDGYLRMASGTGGIQFGGDTAAANALDDYEEGTWTAGIAFGGASVGVTYTSNTGNYTKIGNLVVATMLISLSNKGSSSGAATITGLPFSSLSFGSVALGQVLNTSFADVPYGYTNGTIITLQETTNAGGLTNLDNTNFTNTSQLIVTAIYRV